MCYFADKKFWNDRILWISYENKNVPLCAAFCEGQPWVGQMGSAENDGVRQNVSIVPGQLHCMILTYRPQQGHELCSLVGLL